MNYKIIHDEDKLKEFIEWLPDLNDNEQFYLSLFARKKYCKSLIKSNDKTQLKRFTSTKERLLHKIKQLEIPLGLYKLRDQDVPQESLVLYILPNPRCMAKANRLMGKKCWDLDRSKNYNLVSEAMSCVQRAKSRAFVVDFDIDTDDEIDWSIMNNIIPFVRKDLSEPYTVLKTKGGYHLLVKPVIANMNILRFNSGNYQSPININWHGAIRKYFGKDMDQSGDQMMPVPGSIQGDFIPKFIK